MQREPVPIAIRQMDRVGEDGPARERRRTARPHDLRSQSAIAVPKLVGGRGRSRLALPADRKPEVEPAGIGWRPTHGRFDPPTRAALMPSATISSVQCARRPAATAGRWQPSHKPRRGIAAQSWSPQTANSRAEAYSVRVLLQHYPWAPAVPAAVARSKAPSRLQRVVR